MDHDVWNQVMLVSRLAARGVQPSVERPTFSDLLIVRMCCWANFKDRPQSWAANPKHYHQPFRPGKLPSVSQFNRRVQTQSVNDILQKMHRITAETDRVAEVDYIDGKAMTVSPVSKDPQATRGHVRGGFAKGYKLHMIVSDDLRIRCWSVTSLHVAEQSAARAMAGHLTPGSLVLADSNYDSAPLYKSLYQAGITYFTRLKGQKQVKDGQHHPVTLRQMGAARRAAVAMWQNRPALCLRVIHQRDAIERTISALTSYGGGLGPFPAWVRTLPRVTRWAGIKIIFYHLRLRLRKAAKNRATA